MRGLFFTAMGLAPYRVIPADQSHPPGLGNHRIVIHPPPWFVPKRVVIQIPRNKTVRTSQEPTIS